MMKFKGLSFLWCALSALFTLPALAQDHMTASMTPTSNPAEWTLEIHMENPDEDNLTAFQLDLVLPQGFSVVENSAKASSRLPDHTVVVSKHPSSVYKVAAYSLNNTVIAGNSGSVATISITAEAAAESGTYTATLNNIYISDRKGNEGQFDNTSVSWMYEKVALAPTITYLVEGNEYATLEQTPGEAPLLPQVPEKEGHTFAGWANLPDVMPNENLTVEAVFTVNSYWVTYFLDGEEFTKQEVKFGDTLQPPTAPEKEGYEFQGWAEVPETMPANDVEIQGAYAVKSYLLTYIVDGEVFQQTSVDFGVTLTPPVAPEKEGHTFVGWGEVPLTMPAEDVTLTAVYTANVYTLTYLLDGEVYAEVSIPYGEVIVPLEVELDDTREFNGWTNLPDTMPAHDVTVTGSTTLTAISGLASEAALVNVYSVDGKLIAKQVTMSWAKRHLSVGVYIINGKTYFLSSLE